MWWQGVSWFHCGLLSTVTRRAPTQESCAFHPIEGRALCLPHCVLCAGPGPRLPLLPQLTEDLPRCLRAQTRPHWSSLSPSSSPSGWALGVASISSLCSSSISCLTAPSKQEKQPRVVGVGWVVSVWRGVGAIRELSYCRTRGF